jgi:hypothetical protein
MGGPEKPTLSPEQLRLQEQAKADRIEGIQDRVSDDTRDLLLRFGRNKALSGSSGSAAPASSLPGSLGLFGGRKLDLLRGMGRF